MHRPDPSEKIAALKAAISPAGKEELAAKRKALWDEIVKEAPDVAQFAQALGNMFGAKIKRLEINGVRKI